VNRAVDKGSAAVDEARRRAVLERDESVGDTFFFAVTSTGVFCRPGCPARAPKRENTLYFDDAAAAARAGFRPCARCRPLDAPPVVRRAALIVEACRRIDEAETPPSLEETARVAGMSEVAFRRLFKNVVGVTPKAFAMERRLERMEALLQPAGSVTEAMYDAGFNTPSRFYETVGESLGMRPSSVRSGGAGERIRAAVAPYRPGFVIVATTARGICAILFDDDTESGVKRLRARFPQAEIVDADPEFTRDLATTVERARRADGSIELPRDIARTAFRLRLRSALRASNRGD